jgi:glycosyltransferase involved in cell wall biosynthesis
MITVVIPTYNRSNLLNRAIQSVLDQTFQDRCIIVMDNNSSDDTSVVVNKYIANGEKIKYICNETNLGGLKNFYLGINEVETDYYCLLSDDDFLLPSFMEKIMEGFKDPEVMFSCAKTIIADLPRDSIFYRNQDWDTGFYYPSNKIICKTFNSHFTSTGVVFKKEVRSIIGPFDVGGTDVLYLTFAAASFKFYVADYYGAVFTVHKLSYTNSGGISSEAEERLFEIIKDTLNEVTKLQINNEKKVLLSKLILDYYMPVLRVNKCTIDKEFSISGVEVENDWRCLKINKYELIIGVFKLLPNFTKPISKIVANYINSIIKLKEKRWFKLNGVPISKNIRPTLEFNKSEFLIIEKWVQSQKFIKK